MKPDIASLYEALSKWPLKLGFAHKLDEHNSAKGGFAQQVDPVSIPEQANLVKSELDVREDHEFHGRQIVMLDIDVPARLVPSTTEGHSHLYIDVPSDWGNIVELMKVLVKMKIVEKGFMDCAVKRGYTCLRPPWVRKGDQKKPGRRPLPPRPGSIMSILNTEWTPEPLNPLAKPFPGGTGDQDVKPL